MVPRRQVRYGRQPGMPRRPERHDPYFYGRTQPGPRRRERPALQAPAASGGKGILSLLKKGKAEPAQPAVPKKSPFLNQLKTADGQWDFDKLMKAGDQLQRMYGQVSPLLTRFIAKK